MPPVDPDSDRVAVALRFVAEARRDADLVTVVDLVRVAESALVQAGRWPGHAYASHRQEAWALVAGAQGLRSLPRDYLPARLTSGERERVFELLHERLATLTPLPYLLGGMLYAGMWFEVRPGTFLPRNAIARVLDDVLATVAWSECPRHLDLGTGVGAVAVAVCARRRDVAVDATDVSSEALAVARRNAGLHGLGGRIEFHFGSLFEPVPDDRRYDLITANLPYIPEARRSGISSEVAKEPTGAIFSPGDGLGLTRAVLMQAANHLSDKGQLAIEVGVGDQSREVDWIIDGRGRWWEDEGRPLGLLTVHREELVR